MFLLTSISMGLLGLIGAFLIFIILLQRGRGGGLAGALGGMGGQSAFGTKAGDMFTRITVVLALIWIVLCAGLIPMARATSNSRRTPGTAAATEEIEAAPTKEAPANAFPTGKSDDADEMQSTEPEGEKSAAPGADDESAKPDEKADEPAKSDEKPDAEKSTKEDSKPDSEEKKPDGESE